MLNKRRFISAIVLLGFLLSWGCARAPVPKTDLALEEREAEWVLTTLSGMTLEEKIGQMVCVNITTRFMNRHGESWRELVNLVTEFKVGGMILYGGDVYETAYLTNSLQKLARVPLLFSADYERGAGSHVEGATLFPPLMSLGAVGLEELVYEMGRITAIEGRAMGVHMTYAPVVDVNINPLNPIINTRSFGEDPDQVGRLAYAFIRGCQEHLMLATAKHFPGHGDTELDSHLKLAVVSGDRERLDRVELAPFRAAVKAGVQAVMVSHLHVPALDSTPSLPATLSPVIIRDVLRNEMGFYGLVVTDALNMGGVTTLFTQQEAAVRAVEAGVDMLLYPLDPRLAVKALIEAVQSGRISAERVDYSVRRILEAKARLGLHISRLVDIEALADIVGRKEHRETSLRLTESSVTLVKNSGDLLPLDNPQGTVSLLSLSADQGDDFAGRPFVREFLKRKGATAFYADSTADKDLVRKALEKASQADLAVVLLFSRVTSHKGTSDLDPGHIQAVKDLIASQPRTIVISFGSPYFMRHFPEAPCYLCAYRYSDEAQTASVKALFGEIEVTGRLPVSLPGLYPAGHGIRLPKKVVE